ncbi:mediator complex subunit [Xylographa opegraphella]|nr:mediator complex subunit [Xylographa opegraphella]
MLAKDVEKIENWRVFFSRCMLDHLEFGKFPHELRAQSVRSPLSGRFIYQAWIQQRHGSARLQDRLLCYFELLLQGGVLTDAEVLGSIARDFNKIGAFGENGLNDHAGRSTEAAVLDRLSFQMIQRRAIVTAASERIDTLHVAKPLISLLSTFTQTLEHLIPLEGPFLEIGNALGQYVGAYINELSKVGLLTSKDGGPPKDLKTWFSRYLPPFTVLISPSNAQLGQALDILQKQSGLHDESVNVLGNAVVEGVDLDSLAYQENVLDNPLIITRAALYIYINAMLIGRPLFNDVTLFKYLNVRYSGGIPTLVTDLITATFDVLANAINRAESNGGIFIYRSFLTNKLPVLLESYSTMIFPPYNIESCIAEGLGRMDPPADPYSTQSFDLLDSSGMLSEARAEFLFSCALYGLIPEQSIESILGDVPMQSLPEGGKYQKTDLVAQCTANPVKIEEFVWELENMEGNAAEIARALVEILQSLCNNKDTMTLKIICNALSRKSRALNVLMIFCQPSTILQPLCELLDHWQVHEDQGEHQPVYDEFGSILLLVLVFRQHFNLPDSELGISYADSFILKYIRRGCISRDPSELSDKEKMHLGGWIKGLFETEGISDELISTCGPQEFYLLVATLFDQSLKACEAGVLGLETLKGGFEYLLEPFLLPSLIAGLSWSTRRLLTPLSTSTTSLSILLPALSLLVHPPSLSSDALSLHEAVLAVTTVPLDRALVALQKLHPKRQDIESLLTTLKSRIRHPRNTATSASELESWCGTPGGSILSSLYNSIMALVNWSTTGVSNAAPPNYTHRLLLTAATMLGAKVVLGSLLDMTLKHAANEAADVVLDIVTALICAPTANDGRERLSLRHALQSAYNGAFALSKHDAARAEIIVRLHRRVQSQGGSSTPGEIEADLDVNAAMDAAVAVDGNEMLLDMENGTGVTATGQAQMVDAIKAGMEMDLHMANVMDDVGGAEDFLGM